MVVLVDSVGAMVAAERVFQAPGVIRYLVDDPFFKEGFQVLYTVTRSNKEATCFSISE